MRKFLTSALIITILLLFFGCSKEKPADIEISEVNLTDFEESLISIMSENTFMYDLKINNPNIKEVIGKVDYYEKGNFIRTIQEFSEPVNEVADEPIRILFAHQYTNDEEARWIASIISQDGYTSGTSDSQVLKEFETATWSSANMPLALKKGETGIVAYIIHANQNEITVDNDIKTAADVKKLSNFEQVYVMSIESK